MLVLNKQGSLSQFEPDLFKSIGIKIDNLGGSVVDIIERLTEGDLSRKQIKQHIKNGAVYVGDSNDVAESETLDGGNIAVAIYIGKRLLGIVLPGVNVK